MSSLYISSFWHSWLHEELSQPLNWKWMYDLNANTVWRTYLNYTYYMYHFQYTDIFLSPYNRVVENIVMCNGTSLCAPVIYCRYNANIKCIEFKVAIWYKFDQLWALWCCSFSMELKHTSTHWVISGQCLLQLISFIR